jgi:Tfp pilus assembly protein PilF
MALLKYESGDVSACQRLLTRAVSLNPLNPLAAVSLVHLHIEAGKLDNAMLLLQRMITDDVVTEQALLMQGDLYVMLQNESDAIECFSRLLQFPKTAKPAAERLIPILQKQGRDNEAEFLFKKYAKGCC